MSTGRLLLVPQKLPVTWLSDFDEVPGARKLTFLSASILGDQLHPCSQALVLPSLSQ